MRVNLSLDAVHLRSSGTLDQAIALAVVGCRLALVILAATSFRLTAFLFFGKQAKMARMQIFQGGKRK